MALLTLESKYIKLYANGMFEIYKNKAARDAVKNGISSKEVLEKYNNILQTLDADKEFKYYNPAEFAIQYDGWRAEFERYSYNLDLYRVGEVYPLMASIYPDVADSIPNILEAGQIDIAEDTVDKLYLRVKERGYWAETSDI